MAYSNSSLVNYAKESPNKGSRNGNPVEIITIHCTAGNKDSTAQGIVDLPHFQTYSTSNASCNYAVGGDGSIGLCVSEQYRSWCTSSSANDKKAVTIEVASNVAGTEVTAAAYQATILLCADICKRNGISQLKWLNDKNLKHTDPSRQNMTVHRWYANKSCPGEFLFSRLGQIADAVNQILGNPSKYAQLVASRPVSGTVGTPFVPRLTKPEAGNKYYITKGRGGYSDAIQGSPTDRDCNVLANCVGYAYGRFNEIGQYGYCKYLRPTNAENFIESRGDLQVGQEPKLGACMVWRKGPTLGSGDGAGHVAIVEKIISPTEIVTSESGWQSSAFWTKTRHKGNGNWGSGAGYTFRGFIYNPAVTDDAYVVGEGGLNASFMSYTRQITFADLGIDEDKIAPFIATIDPTDKKIDFDGLKNLKVSGLMLFAGQKYNDATHTARTVFRATNLKEQVEACQDNGMIFALYTKVLARSVNEAKEELQQLYYTISRYPPGLGLWLALRFPANQSKELNNKILDTYYERLVEYGLAEGCGLYVTPEELDQIDWDTYKDRFQLWIRDICDTQDEADSIDIKVEPSFFKLTEEGEQV